MAACFKNLNMRSHSFDGKYGKMSQQIYSH